MATLDIPSVPSTDLNRMMNFVLSSGLVARSGLQKTGKVAPQVEDEYTEAEQSPEPPTPKFGASDTPSFSESNAQFGFRFPSNPSKTARALTANTGQPESNSVSTEYLLVQEDTNAFSEQTVNIPTTVLDSDGESTLTTAEMPTILLTQGVGKPASYIRFLNEPIPLNNVQYEHEEVNVDRFRRTDGFEKPRILADIDAIQKMEDEPSSSGSEESQLSQDQCVPMSSATLLQYGSTVDGSAVQMYQQELVLGDMDVAAYQSVGEGHTYTELKPRRVRNNREARVESNVSDSENLPRVTDTLSQGHEQEVGADSVQDDIERLNVTIARDVDAALSKAPVEEKFGILLKNELKHKIQMKRLQEGKGMLQVTFENKPIGEPSEEEKTKAYNRKMKNRESAVRSRQKRQQLMTQLEKEVKLLERENKQLAKEIMKLKDENSQIAQFPCTCGYQQITTERDHVMFAEENNQPEDEENSHTLQEAINKLLASEANT